MPAAVPLAAALFATGGTLAAGGLAALTLTEGLMLAGGALSTIGGITKNSKLQKIGMVLGLGAGVASLSGLSANAAATAAEQGATATAGSTVADATGSAANLAEAGTAGAAAGELNTAGAIGGEGIIANEAASQLADVSAMPGQAAWGAEGLPKNLAGISSPGNVASGGTAGGGWWDQTKDAIKSGATWMKENPELTKVGSGILGGAMNYYGGQSAADAALAREKKYQDWVRQRYSDSVRNLQLPGPFGIGSAPGLIGGARG